MRTREYINAVDEEENEHGEYADMSLLRNGNVCS
jgi:hypothetical protein